MSSTNGPSRSAKSRSNSSLDHRKTRSPRVAAHGDGRIAEWSGCEAIGIRLSEGDDFPYFETRGFPPEFVLAENHLCEVDSQGELLRDSQGNPVLGCMCGNMIRGRFDPAKPFFTAGGSFWTNSTTALLAGTTEADRQARTRNRCNGEGYESVALSRCGPTARPSACCNSTTGGGTDSRRTRFPLSNAWPTVWP